MILRLEDLKINGDLDGITAEKGDNLHRLFYYPAMMVPVIQSQIMAIISDFLPNPATAIDPFMGSGTSLMSCMEYGLGLYGQDINPLSVLLVKAKTAVLDVQRVQSAKEKIWFAIESDHSESVDVRFSGIDKWFTRDVQVSLSKIRRAIISLPDKEVRSLFWIIMAEVIRIDSNDRTSTFKLHQRQEKEIASRCVDVVGDFFALINRGIIDLKAFRNKLETKGTLVGNSYSAPIEIKWGNTMYGISSSSKIDILVSSPPYGDNQTTVTYGQHSYLPLQWIPRSELPDDVDYDYLRTTQEIDSKSLGGRSNKRQVKDLISSISNRIPSLGAFLDRVPPEDIEKYYKTVSFIADFEQSLDAIIPAMKDNAIYVWTIGNRFVNKQEVPNNQILIDLMANHRIPLIFDAERTILNKKQAKRNRSSRTMEKERILIFQKQ
ncbi:MAG: hypothetical protein IKX71_03130 [Bacteroidales bacterium]|nr:hypothetical protein [Bacteroidales bacterium]